MVKMTSKVKVNYIYFQYQLRVSQDAYMVQIWWFQLKYMTSYGADKPNSLKFYVKMAKLTQKVKVNDLHL